MKWHQFWTKIFSISNYKKILMILNMGWEKVSEIFEDSKYEVICYSRELENSDVLVMRIQGEMKNVTQEQFTRMHRLEEEEKSKR